MPSLRSSQLLNHLSRLFGGIRQHFSECFCSLPCIFSFFLLLLCMSFCSNKETVCSKQTFICLPPVCGMCNSGNPCHLHVCAFRCVCVFCLQLVYFSWCDFLIQTSLNRALLLPSVVKLLAKQGWGIQTNAGRTANGSCQACIAELTSSG